MHVRMCIGMRVCMRFVLSILARLFFMLARVCVFCFALVVCAFLRAGVIINSCCFQLIFLPVMTVV